MPPKLLLADGSVAIQRVIELTFAGEGVEVIVAGTSAQAIARAESERPDIVLADIGTPESGGYALLAFIKSHPQLAGIPVVLLTSAVEPLDEERIRRAGCDGVLAKPLEPRVAVDAVKALLSAPADASASGQQAPAAAGAPSAGDPLDVYFDRLDAAFATLAAAPPRATADSPVAGDAGSPAGSGRLRQHSLSNEFVALFAPEPTDGTTDPAPSRPVSLVEPSLIPDDVLDEIARRVIARLSDEAMKRLVIETAERMVREEIERIKQTSDPGSTHSAG